ncbi:MAG TPA: acyl carrier protein [Bryobacteraceae bacterium]|nr:acyl carrier protein [Bryobacteraceae bacterium]
MNDLDTRLRRCFSTAFPNLSPEAIPSAEQTEVEGWDSVAAITLIALIEEEFAAPIDLEALPELTSYRAIREYLERA